MKSDLIPRLGLLWLLAAIIALQVSHYPFTPDSYAYVAAAESLVERGDLTVPFAPSSVSRLPVPYSAWPPGYPVTIALLRLCGLTSWAAARILALVGVLVALFLFRRSLRDAPMSDLIMVIVTVSATGAICATSAWSEGLFLACVLGTWSGTLRWRSAREPEMRSLLFAASCAACAMLLRYSGVFLVPAMIWLIWRRGQSLRQWAGTWMTLVATLPLGLWLMRNADLPVGWRGATPRPPDWWRGPAEFARAAGELTVAPPGVPALWQAVCGALLLGAVATLLWRRRKVIAASAILESATVFLMAGTAVLILARAAGVAGPLSTRLIWPVFPFLTVVCCASVTSWRVTLPRTAKLVLLLYIIAQSLTVALLPRIHPSWERTFAASDLPAWLQKENALLANRGWLVWHQTNRTVYYLPMTAHAKALLAPDTISSWAARRAVRYFVWQDENLTPVELKHRYGEWESVLALRDSSNFRPVWSNDNTVVFEIVQRH